MVSIHTVSGVDTDPMRGLFFQWQAGSRIETALADLLMAVAAMLGERFGALGLDEKIAHGRIPYFRATRGLWLLCT